VSDALELEFDVRAPVPHAFEIWTARTDLWWPRGHTVSRDEAATIVFEPGPGGRIFERTPAGAEHAWGEVLEWEPPSRLVYLWHLMFDRSEATEVEVTFAARGDATAVRIRQTGFDRLGAAGAARRERTGAGWRAVVSCYLPVASAERAEGAG
jgi:uncharacterized protein YndB with AHSA1/START domain